MEKASSSGRSHQEALTGLRAQPLGDGLPSLAEILHGRSLVTRKASPVDLTVVHQSLIALQAKYTKCHDKAKRAKTQWALVIGEKVYFLSGKNEWQIGIVTGTTDTWRSYNILTDEGTSLRRNRSHLKPRCHDIPVIARNIACRTSTSSQSEITENQLSRPQHPPKVNYSYNNKQNISFQDHYKQHPPKSEIFTSRTTTSSQSEIFSRKCTETCNQTSWRYCLWLLYCRDTVFTEECHQAQEGDKVCRGPSEQCQDHTSKVDQVTPSQMDHQSRRPRLADTNRVVTSQGRKWLNSRPRRRPVRCDEP